MLPIYLACSLLTSFHLLGPLFCLSYAQADMWRTPSQCKSHVCIVRFPNVPDILTASSWYMSIFSQRMFYVLDSNFGIASSNLHSNKYNRILIRTIIKLTKNVYSFQQVQEFHILISIG
jgi:hypothetical protein